MKTPFIFLTCLSVLACQDGHVTGTAVAIDGDTLYFHHSGTRVRIMGIDAEEMNEPFGRAARMTLFTITNQKTIECRFTGETSYARSVGICHVDGRDIAELLVSSGYVLDCYRYSGGKYRSFEPPGARSRLRQKPYC